MKVTEEMRKAAEETRTYSYWRTPNIVGPEVPKVLPGKKDRRRTGDAIFTWGRIVSGENEPTYRVFYTMENMIPGKQKQKSGELQI